jgi:hypothetical protein
MYTKLELLKLMMEYYQKWAEFEKKYKNYFKSGFSNFSKLFSREIREKYYFEFLEKFSRRTQSSHGFYFTEATTNS